MQELKRQQNFEIDLLGHQYKNKINKFLYTAYSKLTVLCACQPVTTMNIRKRKIYSKMGEKA